MIGPSPGVATGKMYTKYPATAPKPPDPVSSSFDTYGTAAKQQGQDYTDLMGKFRSFYDEAGNSAGGFNKQLDITLPSYNTSEDYTKAIGNLGELSKTGGYSQEDIANLRARGVSPVRSVYASAKRDMNRQKSLQGGYSPNMAAASVKMARDMSGKLADVTTNVNADIAKSVAQNRIATATPYASITAGEQGARNQFEQNNAEMANKYGFQNIENSVRSLQIPLQMRLSALNGMTGLYGSTPGNTALMQHGALSMAELQNQINQQNKNYDLNLTGMYK